MLQSLYPASKLAVSIERCDEAGAADLEERIRRKRFYEKNGFVDTGYLIRLGNAEQELLMKNGAFSKRELSLFFLQYGMGAIWPKIWKKDSG